MNSSDEEFGMTHGGRDIDDMEGDEIAKYGGVLDEKDGNLDPDFVGKLNFSGFAEDGGNFFYFLFSFLEELGSKILKIFRKKS